MFSYGTKPQTPLKKLDITDDLSANEMLFLLLNLKEQQNKEDRRLLFLNISSSSRVIPV